jgi:hypothetical protein
MFGRSGNQPEKTAYLPLDQFLTANLPIKETDVAKMSLEEPSKVVPSEFRDDN